MMKDMEAGNINCIIVKDLSRLGRDYIEAGRLIQKTFPAFSVRFIALTDHFDSLTADYNEAALVVPVKNFVNDSYARDISNKVRSHQRIKRRNGDFIGAFAVFGYKKSQANRNLLVPDDYAACIVRKIFAWKIEGYSNFAIAALLEELGILSPMEYKRLQGENFQTGFVTGVKAKWSGVAVKRILENEAYIGTLAQGKEEKINYKVKKSVRKPKEEWIRVENAHKAIISKEDFFLVQDLLKFDTRRGISEEKSHIYAGLLFCGDCKEPMVRRINWYKGKRRAFFICSTRNKGKGCKRHTISEEVLGQLVLTGIRQQIALFLEKDKVCEAMGWMENYLDEAALFQEEIEKLRREGEFYVSLQAGLYEDWKKHIISEEDFKAFHEIYRERYKEIEQAANRQEEALKKLFKIKTQNSRKQVEEFMEAICLDRLCLVSFVKRILVYEDKRLYLEFRYEEPFSKGFLDRRNWE